MKQTAVQLVYKLLKSGLPPEQVVNYLLIDEELVLEKEKEQIMDAWRIGWSRSFLDDEHFENEANKYYNETFNINEK